MTETETTRRTFFTALAAFPPLALLGVGKKTEDETIDENDEMWADIVLYEIDRKDYWQKRCLAAERDDKPIDFRTARRRVCEDMANDEGLRISYQANIAMSIFDNSVLTHKSCNRLADHIMRVVFEIEETPDTDIAAGRIKSFSTVDEMLDSLKETA